MPTFDDRFARQNRDGPPSEFPLTSSCAGIVHHLSGPIQYALAHSFGIHCCRLGLACDAGFVLELALLTLRFRCALGFPSPSDSHMRWTPWSVFQDGCSNSLYSSIEG